MHLNTLAISLVLTSTLLTFGPSTTESAESASEATPRQATVLVIAQAIASEHSECVGCPRTARSTGFFTSPYGDLVTSHHLLKNLGQFDPSTLKISIIDGDVHSQPRPAAIEDFDSSRDILTLKTPEHPEGFKYLKYADRAREKIEAGKTKVFTLGFPKGYPSHFSDSGIIKSFDGPFEQHFLWVTDMEFKEGQSGSPVYLEDGTVIGIVKGIEKDVPKNSFIVPINYVKRLKTQEASLTSNVLRVVAQVKGKEPQVRELTRSFYEINNHCASSRNVDWTVNADEGWKIDTASVTTSVETATSNSSFTGVRELDSKGFVLSGTLGNTGECVQVFEQTLAKDGRGSLGVSVKYKEKKESDYIIAVPVYKGAVQSGVELSQQLPDNTQAFTVFLEDNQGKVISQKGPGTNGRLTVDTSGPSGILKVLIGH